MPRIDRGGRENKSCAGCVENIQDEDYYIAVQCGSGKRRGVWVQFYDNYHIKCYAKSENTRKLVVTYDLTYYESYTDKDPELKRILDATLFPNVIDEKKRAKLKLPKPIDKLTVKQLKLELLKRDRKPSGNKEKLIKQLKDCINMIECRENRSNKLSIGYCRQMTMKYKLNMPRYLKAIVQQYYFE